MQTLNLYSVTYKNNDGCFEVMQVWATSWGHACMQADDAWHKETGVYLDPMCINAWLLNFD